MDLKSSVFYGNLCACDEEVDWSNFFMFTDVTVKVADQENQTKKKVEMKNNNNNNGEIITTAFTWPRITKKRSNRHGCILEIIPKSKKLKLSTTHDHVSLNIKVENHVVAPLPPCPPEIVSRDDKNGPQPPPSLPEQFNKVVRELSGAQQETINHNLVIQKKLTGTDVSSGQNRLSIPLKKLSCGDFLTDDEKIHLSSRDEKRKMNFLEVKIIEPLLRQRTVKLRRWEMKKENGNASVSYVLTGSWSKIVSGNKLKEDMTVQLWATRIEGELYFTLVKL